jgi:probable biosynthetic protein (TIGR04098 family)
LGAHTFAACSCPSSRQADRYHFVNPMTEINPLLILKQEIPGFSADDLNTPFELLAVDSFTLVALRARLEQYAGREVDDEKWTLARMPADLLAMFSSGRTHIAPDGIAKATRSFNINMPQMAMGGLSESWLFKELGDMHWQMLTDGLQSPSSALCDGSGNRLYATFTRISVAIAALSSYQENGLFILTGEISRFGGGMFFSEIDVTSGRAQLMSSFSKRGENGSNVALLKEQPKIPPNCKIAEHSSLPPICEEYRAVRAADLPDSIFSCDYEIVPQHDVNGVGLLYFAAYPIISDICESRFASPKNSSTIKRDVFYFSNCDPDETLVFRLHRRNSSNSILESETSLSRKSDGVLMSRIFTTRGMI